MKSFVRQKSKIMTGRHRILECSICRKTIRVDNLKRHWRTKHKMFDMGFTVTVEAKSKVGESSSTGNNLELDILDNAKIYDCLLYTSPSPRDRSLSRMPSSA